MMVTVNSTPDVNGNERIPEKHIQSDVEAEEEDHKAQCGLLCLRPHCLQHARTARCLLFWMCCAAAVQGIVVNGFVNVSITTIEKRFNLRSRDSGLIVGSYDMAALITSIPASYLGSRPGASKPRWLGMGLIIMGFGSYVFALPHFITPPYNVQPLGHGAVNESAALCDDAVVGSASSTMKEVLAGYRFLFMFGQVLHGLGAIPIYTLGVAFLDESVKPHLSSLYLGIFYSMAVLGPALGYGLGGRFLLMYIDTPTVDPTALGLSPAGSQWLGGWWIGFLLAGTAAFVVAWPLMSLPRSLPSARSRHTSKVAPAVQPADKTQLVGPSKGESWGSSAGLKYALRCLVRNPVFVFLTIAETADGFLMAGFASFMPKLIESQFIIPAGTAAFLIGVIAVPSGGIGTFMGGWIIKRWQMGLNGLLKHCMVASFLCLLLGTSMLISCDKDAFAGVNIHYGDELLPRPATIVHDLSSACNSWCGCKDVPYTPVCGANSVTYYSPCHAGCQQRTFTEGAQIFSNCSCVSTALEQSLFFAHEEGSLALLPSDLLTPNAALSDRCPSSCTILPFYLMFWSFIMFLMFVVGAPNVSGTLKCVDGQHNALALGLQGMVFRAFGTIPSPIIFGLVIDKTCLLWQSVGDDQGACSVYDTYYLSRYMLALFVTFKFVSLMSFVSAWLCWRRQAAAQETLCITLQNSTVVTSPAVAPSAVASPAVASAAVASAGVASIAVASTAVASAAVAPDAVVPTTAWSAASVAPAENKDVATSPCGLTYDNPAMDLA